MGKSKPQETENLGLFYFIVKNLGESLAYAKIRRDYSQEAKTIGKFLISKNVN